MNTYSHLTNYARFLLQNHLHDFVTICLARAREVHLPLLTLFQTYTEEQLFNYSKQSLSALLSDLSQDIALKTHHTNLQQWKTGQLPGIAKHQIDAKDLAFNSHARKFALFKLLPRYSQDWQITGALIAEIDTFYSHYLEASLQVFVEIQQEEIRKEKEFLQTILDHTEEGVSVVDAQDCILLWNRALEERTGLSRMEVIGKSRFEIFPPYQHPAETQALQQALKGKKTKLLNMPYPDKTGFYEADIIPLPNPSQATVSALIVSRDITERKQTEQHLLGQSKIIEGLLTSFPMILSKLDKQGTILECRGQGLQAAGIADNLLVGSNALAVFPQIAPQIRQVLQGENLLFEGMVPLDDEKKLYFHNFYFYDPQSGGAVGVAIDITPQKVAQQTITLQNQELCQALEELQSSEEQLISLNHELEQRVAERTVALQQSYQEIERQRNRLNSLFMQAPAAVCILGGEDLMFELVNPPYQQLFLGRELLGKPVRAALPEIVGQPIEQILQGVYDTGQAFIGKELFLELIREEGGKKEGCFFNFIYQPRLNEQEQVDGIIVFAYEVTELVMARKTVEESAHRFQMLLEAIPAMAWTNTPSGEVTFFNKRWYDYTGLSVAESLLWGWQNSIHPDDLPRTLKTYTHALASGEIFEIENRFRQRADGAYRWHLNRATPLKNEEGTIYQWVGTCTDIHNQKLAEQERQRLAEELAASNEELSNTVEQLAASEEELRQTLEQAMELNSRLSEQENFLSSILDQSPFSTWIANKEGTLIRMNEAFRKLFGFAHESQVLDTYNILQDNTLQAQPFFKEIQAVFSEGKIIRVELEYDIRQVEHVHIPSGKPICIVLTLFPIRNRHGEISNVVVQHEDITEQKKAEAALDYQHKLNKIITDNATSTLFMMNASGHCTFMNPAGEKMFGYSFEEISQRPLHDMIHHHHPDGSLYPLEECPIDRALPQNSDIRAHEDTFFRKDGSSFPVSCAASPIFEHEQPVATVIEVRDISLEKEAQQQLLEKNAELQKINTDLDNFIYAASHDLKSPIANLEGFLKVLTRRLKHQVGEQEWHMLEMMNEAVLKFKETMQGLMDVAKAQKEMTEEKEWVNLRTLLEEVTENEHEMITRTGAEISYTLAEETICFARASLHSIFYNLLSNALKYHCPERTPRIHFQAYQQDSYTLVQIRDNGLGIPEAQLPKLFSMFKRFHSHVEGTGVGLYMIKRVIENNGGKIVVESKEGVGTTFTVYFPATPQAKEMAATRTT